MSDLIGRTLGHYRIVEKIGEGGMGEVYRAHDERLDRDVAIKVLHQDVAQDADRLARFEKEARALAALNHSNIAMIFGLETVRLPASVIPRSAEGATRDLGGGLQDDTEQPPTQIPRRGADAPLARDDRQADTDPGLKPQAPRRTVTFLVMELLEGENLRERIPSDGMPWQKVVEIGAAIADGLAAAHSKGIVHRDLKPENVFITSDGRVKVLDFGLARVTVPVKEDAETATQTPAGTAAGTVMGTVGYMSPEQACGDAPSTPGQRSSSASVAILYEMMAGRRPFEGDTTAETRWPRCCVTTRRRINGASTPSLTLRLVELLLTKGRCRDGSSRPPT